MDAPVARRYVNDFNRIANGRRCPQRKTLADSAHFHFGPRCDQFLLVFSTYPLVRRARSSHSSALVAQS